jgi:hypothetical protein
MPLSVTVKFILLSVILLSVILLSVILLSVILLSVILLGVIQLNAAYIVFGVTTKSIQQFAVLLTVIVLNVSP